MERIRGQTAVRIQGATVQVTTDTARVHMGREAARVPAPKVHIRSNSATTPR